MKKEILIGLLLVTVVAISAIWFLSGGLNPHSEEGFSLVSLENNSLLISDADVVSYNWTSQEITITGAASERLLREGDNLYSFTPGFVIKIDALIAGSNKKLATFLQLLKETAMRSGEAFNLQWLNIDFERRLIILNNPEKGSNPRIFKVSQKLIDMLNALPRRSQRIISNKTLNSLKATFLQTRKRIAHKLQNPRVLKISFHTLRHWKATMEYHRTKDILYVKNLLGHKILEHTELYINLEKTIFGDTYDQEYHVKVAATPQDIKALLETGYEYVCEKDTLLFFRKRK